MPVPEGTLAIRGGALRVLAYGGSVAAGLVAAPFLIRHLGVEDYGRYVTVMSLLVIVASVTDAGLTGIGLREYSVRDPERRSGFMRALLGVRLVLTIGGLAVLMVVVARSGWEEVPLAGFAFASAGLLLLVLHHTYAIPLSADLRLGIVSALELFRSVAIAAATIVLVVLGAGLTAFLAIPVPVGIVLLVLTLLFVRGSIPIAPSLARGEVGRLLRETLPFAAATALGVVFYRFAIVLLSLISTERETGYFSAAFRVIETLTAIPSLLLLATFPVVSRAATEDSGRLAYAVGRMIDVAVIAGCWFALATAVGADDAIALIAGDEFEPSIRVLQIQAIALLATFLVGTWGFALLALRRHAALVIANGAALALGAALTIVLGRRDGAVGAAIGMTIAEFVLFALYVAALARYRPDLRPSFKVLPPTALAVALGAAVALLGGLPPFADVALATAIYFATLFLLRAVPSELLAALPLPRRAGPRDSV